MYDAVYSYLLVQVKALHTEVCVLCEYKFPIFHLYSTRSSIKLLKLLHRFILFFLININEPIKLFELENAHMNCK